MPILRGSGIYVYSRHMDADYVRENQPFIYNSRCELCEELRSVWRDAVREYSFAVGKMREHIGLSSYYSCLSAASAAQDEAERAKLEYKEHYQSHTRENRSEPFQWAESDSMAQTMTSILQTALTWMDIDQSPPPRAGIRTSQ
jgi:hypothetical protein